MVYAMTLTIVTDAIVQKVGSGPTAREKPLRARKSHVYMEPVKILFRASGVSVQLVTVALPVRFKSTSATRAHVKTVAFAPTKVTRSAVVVPTDIVEPDVKSISTTAKEIHASTVDPALT